MPIEIAKGQYIYVQLALVNILADSANRLIADQCWATPSPNPADATAAMIVQTACPQESSVVMFSNGNDRTVRYKMQMFSFAQYPNANIHVHCVVRICGEECEPTFWLERHLESCFRMKSYIFSNISYSAKLKTIFIFPTII